MKKAFWEPPQKPFSKKFMRRKVHCLKQEPCQRWDLITNMIFKRKSSWLRQSYKPILRETFPRIVQDLVPILEGAPTWSKNLYPVLLRRLCRRGDLIAGSSSRMISTKGGGQKRPIPILCKDGSKAKLAEHGLQNHLVDRIIIYDKDMAFPSRRKGSFIYPSSILID